MLKKPVIIAAGAAVALLAVAYFVVLPMMKPKPAATAAAATAEASDATPTAKKHKKPAEPGLMYPLPERVFNLTGAAGQPPHFARLELALEFAQPDGAKTAAKPAAAAAAKPGPTPMNPALEPVTKYDAQINDAIVGIVGGKTMETMVSPDGKEALKKQILDRLTDLIPKPDLIGVYIVQLVVQ